MMRQRAALVQVIAAKRVAAGLRKAFFDAECNADRA